MVVVNLGRLAAGCALEAAAGAERFLFVLEFDVVVSVVEGVGEVLGSGIDCGLLSASLPFVASLVSTCFPSILLYSVGKRRKRGMVDVRKLS